MDLMPIRSRSHVKASIALTIADNFVRSLLNSILILIVLVLSGIEPIIYPGKLGLIIYNLLHLYVYITYNVCIFTMLHLLLQRILHISFIICFNNNVSQCCNYTIVDAYMLYPFLQRFTTNLNLIHLFRFLGCVYIFVYITV